MQTLFLQKRMSETSAKVYEFLNELRNHYFPVAKVEHEELKAYRKLQDGIDEIHPWDSSYYTEKLKQKKLDFSEEALKPYFELNSTIQGLFLHATKLYDLSFEELKENVSTWHPSVRVFKVLEKGSFIGLLYMDLFCRDVKQSGAWASRLQSRGWKAKDKMASVHASLHCNFPEPMENAPNLLTFNEVRTLFHEFGHTLHSLLSKVNYSSISGTLVYRDFVELPSQIMENWILEPESLDLFAKHYETGESIPSQWLEKIRKSEKFFAGRAGMRQLMLCLFRYGLAHT